MKWPPIVELRQYTLHEGQRDTLITLFEENFVESQVASGVTLLGTFRDLEDASKFVWFRGFQTMSQRAESLADFYYGPVWKSHRDAANATMIDSDDVLLLNPIANGTAASMTIGPIATDDLETTTDRGVAEIILLPLAEAPSTDLLAAFRQRVVPSLSREAADEKATASVATLGLLATSTAENSFPALPIREGERFLIWVTGYRNRETYDAFAPARDRALEAANRLPTLVGAPQVVRLDPTSRTAIVFSG